MQPTVRCNGLLTILREEATANAHLKSEKSLSCHTYIHYCKGVSVKPADRVGVLSQVCSGVRGTIVSYSHVFPSFRFCSTWRQ